MTKWLVLGPIPASDTEKPDEEIQKKAFNTDIIADQGGESGIEPTPGLTHSIKDQEYKSGYFLVKSYKLASFPDDRFI